MILNKEKEELYVRQGINMSYEVMKMYYKDNDLYERMLIDIIDKKYKPLKKINVETGDRICYNENLDLNYGKIYKISSKKSEKVYIGSTSFEIDDRLEKHKLDYEYYKLYKLKYCSSYEVIMCGECSIELLEENILREDIHKKESEYISKEAGKCVNILDPLTRKALYDNKVEKELRRKEKDRALLEDTCKYVIENNMVINSMEDMYIVYMEVKNSQVRVLQNLEREYYSLLTEFYRMKDIDIT